MAAGLASAGQRGRETIENVIYDHLCLPAPQGRFAHVECEETATGAALSEDSVADADWFCCPVRGVGSR